MKIRIAFCAVLLAIASSAQAQVLVTLDTGRSAYSCYAAAKSGMDPRGGIADCNAALNIPDLSNENRAATLDNRGVIYDTMKNYEAARADFDASIKVNPDLGDPYLNRGVALIRLDRMDDALADIQKGVRLGISRPQVGYYDLGVAEELMGRITEAYHDYKHALEVDPAYTPATVALTRFRVILTPAPAS